ncbi:MAG: winged helix-turn-helix domain-containing protein [Nitrososphaerales archaeon]
MAVVYRSHFQIIADILNTARDYNDGGSGVSITLLIRKANISYGRITKILARLVDAGLMQEIPEDRTCKYKISERGMAFLQAYTKFHDFVESFGLRA